jgi:hypothetical protein
MCARRYENKLFFIIYFLFIIKCSRDLPQGHAGTRSMDMKHVPAAGK